MPAFTTACPRNCYSTCAMRVHVEGGRLRAIDAHPAGLATPGGARGGVERVSWDPALDIVADRLIALRRDPGPASVFFFAGSGTKGLLNRVSTSFWRLYGGYTTTPR